MVPIVLATFLGFFCPLVSGHAAIFTPAMWGFNVTDKTFSYDNRAVSPLIDMPFDQWWFHGHLDYPPNEGDTFDLPAGQNVTSEIGCNKGATSFFASSEGGDIQSGNDVCPGSPMAEYHTAGFDDLRGCALAIAYKANVSEVQPEDFTIFSVNHTCVWTRHTDFAVPSRMPPCPEGGCICSWFWIHSEDSGGEQNYMNGFRCNVINSTSNVALAQPQVPRRCGADHQAGRPSPTPANCTYGAKQPFYWFQAERNNMFEGTYSPPQYSSMYNFLDGAQDDIFQDSYELPLPSPSPNQTVLPRRLDGLPLRIPDADLLPSNNVTASVGSSSQTASVASTSSIVTSPSTSSALTSAGLSSAPDRTERPTTVISTLFVTVTATMSPRESSFASAALPTTTASSSLSSIGALESTIFLNPAASAAAAIRQGVADGSGTPSNATAFSGPYAMLDDVSDVSDTTDATSRNSSVRGSTNSSICKRGSIVPLNAPDSSSGGSRIRSLANRLGMGVYERKHRMHRRGLEGLWRIW